MSRSRWFALPLAAVATIAISAAHAESAFAPFAALLGDRDGWTAPAATGTALDMGGTKMITAERQYTKGANTVHVTILAGQTAGALAAMADQEINIETSDGSMKTATVGGYRTLQQSDKTHAQITVWFGKDTNGALSADGQGLDGAAILDFVKGFDWKAIANAAKAVK